MNGTEIARGPVRSDPRAAHYDVVDLAPTCGSGPNVIAVTGRHFGTATSWWMPVPPSYSLGAGSMVFEALHRRPMALLGPLVALLSRRGMDAGAGPR